MEKQSLMSPPGRRSEARALMAPDPRYGETLSVAALLWVVAGVLAVVVVSLSLID